MSKNNSVTFTTSEPPSRRVITFFNDATPCQPSYRLTTPLDLESVRKLLDFRAPTPLVVTNGGFEEPEDEIIHSPGFYIPDQKTEEVYYSVAQDLTRGMQELRILQFYVSLNRSATQGKPWKVFVVVGEEDVAIVTLLVAEHVIRIPIEVLVGITESMSESFPTVDRMREDKPTPGRSMEFAATTVVIEQLVQVPLMAIFVERKLEESLVLPSVILFTTSRQMQITRHQHTQNKRFGLFNRATMITTLTEATSVPSFATQIVRKLNNIMKNNYKSSFRCKIIVSSASLHTVSGGSFHISFKYLKSKTLLSFKYSQLDKDKIG